MAEGTQGEQQKTELLLRRQYEVQLLQREQPMPVWTQGEQQKTELLLRRQYSTMCSCPRERRPPLFSHPFLMHANTPPPLPYPSTSLLFLTHADPLLPYRKTPAATAQQKFPRTLLAAPLFLTHADTPLLLHRK